LGGFVTKSYYKLTTKLLQKAGFKRLYLLDFSEKADKTVVLEVWNLTNGYTKFIQSWRPKRRGDGRWSRSGGPCGNTTRLIFFLFFSLFWTFFKVPPLQSMHIATGGEKRTDEEVAELLRLCEECEYYSDGRCTVCGCRLSNGKNAFTNKLRMKSQSCPNGRWGFDSPRRNPASLQEIARRFFLCLVFLQVSYFPAY